MSGAPAPQTLLEPIASDAAGGLVTTPMPDAPTGTNAASVQGGFPAITMTPVLSGGEPPLGQDANGLFLLVSGHNFWVQAGQLYPFSSALATAMGGYALGASVAMADHTGAWFNIVDGNTTDPDGGSAAGWVPGFSNGATVMTGLTGGNVALTAEQAKYKVVRVQGTLTSNLILEFPNQIGQWIIANETSGAFSVTAATTSLTGSVNIPPGGLVSPTQVYCIGGGDVFPVVAPLSVAISVSPSASTVVERDTSGNVLANYFSGATSLENPTVGAVIVQNAAADGLFRKISVANFLVRVFGFSITLGATGNFSLLGLTLKWGTLSIPGSGSGTVTFATAFSAAYAGFLTPAQAASGVPSFNSLTASGFNADNSQAVTLNHYWFVIGAT